MVMEIPVYVCFHDKQIDKQSFAKRVTITSIEAEELVFCTSSVN